MAVRISFARGVPVVLAVCLVAAFAPGARAHTDPHVGTWKLDVAKSKYTPGPPPKQVIVIYEADGPGLSVLAQGIDADGKPINPDKTKAAINWDGKDHPTQTRNPNYDTNSNKRTGNTIATTRKKDGRIVQTVTNVVSKDGKTMTVTTKGSNAKGETINNVAVYHKQ